MPESAVDDPGPGPAGAPGGAASAGVPASAVGSDAAAADARAAAPPDAAGSGGLRVEGLSVVYPAGRG